jgi:hypothetical protein
MKTVIRAAMKIILMSSVAHHEYFSSAQASGKAHSLDEH